MTRVDHEFYCTDDDFTISNYSYDDLVYDLVKVGARVGDFGEAWCPVCGKKMVFRQGKEVLD